MKHLFKPWISFTCVGCLLFLSVACSATPAQTDSTQTPSISTPSVSGEPSVSHGASMNHGETLQKPGYLSYAQIQKDPAYSFEEIKNFSELPAQVFLDEWQEGCFLICLNQQDLETFKGVKQGFPDKVSSDVLASYALADHTLTYLAEVRQPNGFIRSAQGDDTQVFWTEVNQGDAEHDPSWSLLCLDRNSAQVKTLLTETYTDEAVKHNQYLELFPSSLVMADKEIGLIYPKEVDKTLYSCVSLVDRTSGDVHILDQIKAEEGVHDHLSLEKETGSHFVWLRMKSSSNEAHSSQTIMSEICRSKSGDDPGSEVAEAEGAYLSVIQYGDRYFAIESLGHSGQPDKRQQHIVGIVNHKKMPFIEYEMSTASADDVSYSLFALEGNKRFMGLAQSGGLPILFDVKTGNLIEVSDFKLEKSGYYKLVRFFDHYAVFLVKRNGDEEATLRLLHLPD